VPDEGAHAKKLLMEVVDAEYQWYICFSFLTPRAMIAPVTTPVHLYPCYFVISLFGKLLTRPQGPPQAHILLCHPRNTGRHDDP
jgi:hypothetical protein